MKKWIKVPRSHNDSPVSEGGVTHHPGTASVDCYSQNPDGSAVKTGGYWEFEGRHVSDLSYCLKDDREQKDADASSATTFAFNPDNEMELIVADAEGNLFVVEKNHQAGMVVYKIDEAVPEEFLATAE